MTRPGRSREEWRRLIEEWRSCSETAEKFCERHDVGLSTFRWWRWRLKQDDTARRPPRRKQNEEWVEVAPIQLPSTEKRASDSDSDLTLLLGEGIAIRVPVGFDGPTLERLIQTLGVIEC